MLRGTSVNRRRPSPLLNPASDLTAAWCGSKPTAGLRLGASRSARGVGMYHHVNFSSVAPAHGGWLQSPAATQRLEKGPEQAERLEEAALTSNRPATPSPWPT
jgi:hypothetical protein